MHHEDAAQSEAQVVEVVEDEQGSKFVHHSLILETHQILLLSALLKMRMQHKLETQSWVVQGFVCFNFFFAPRPHSNLLLFVG